MEDGVHITMIDGCIAHDEKAQGGAFFDALHIKEELLRSNFYFSTQVHTLTHSNI